MTALALGFAALTVAGWAGIRAHRYHRDRTDEQWADDTIRWLRSMRPGQDFADHADRALFVVADDLEWHRLEQTMRRHPAGGAR